MTLTIDRENSCDQSCICHAAEEHGYCCMNVTAYFSGHPSEEAAAKAAVAYYALDEYEGIATHEITSHQVIEYRKDRCEPNDEGERCFVELVLEITAEITAEGRRLASEWHAKD